MPLQTARRWRSKDGLVARAAPLGQGRSLGVLGTALGDDPLSWALKNRLYHTTWMTGDELLVSRWDNWQFPPWRQYLLSYSFSGESDGEVESLEITGGAAGWRQGWEPGGTRIATGVQQARNAQSKLGPKLFAFTFETQRITTLNGGTPVTEETLDSINGDMTNNSDEWVWLWPSFPVIHGDQPVPQVITPWDGWGTFTMTDAGTSSGGGLTASWSLSITVTLT